MAERSTLVVGELARSSLERLLNRLEAEAPELSVVTANWMRSLSTTDAADYFTHVEAFPMLSLPWWMEESFGRGVDEAFQSDLAYSSVSGYYFVRLLDDAMDGASPPPVVLPAAILFHTEFFATYQSLFPPESPFWASLRRFSYDSAETASADAHLSQVDLGDFVRISSRKVSGAKIPLAAVARRYERDDKLAPWAGLVDVLGRWHQMRNDVLGWISDSARGRATYFLSEASRRAGPGETVAEWVVREGLAWAAAAMNTWMDALLESARAIGSAPLVAYLESRRDLAQKQQDVIGFDLGTLSRLAASLDARR